MTVAENAVSNPQQPTDAPLEGTLLPKPVLRIAPTPYSPTAADTILGRLSAGETLEAIAEDPWMPSLIEIEGWVRQNPENFTERYEMAVRNGIGLLPYGLPENYKKAYCKLAKQFCLMGAKDKDLAEFLGVRERDIVKWKAAIPAFSKACRDGREGADARVARKLYKRACGYVHPETKVVLVEGQPQLVTVEKHYPPDTTAALKWLENRQPDHWKDKKEMEFSGQITVVPMPYDGNL